MCEHDDSKDFEASLLRGMKEMLAYERGEIRLRTRTVGVATATPGLKLTQSNDMVEPLAFRAEITLLSQENGGRQGAIRSGYRVPISFGWRNDDGEKRYHESVITLLEIDQLRPGATALVEVIVSDGALVQAAISAQATFEVAEGPRRIVGNGVITNVPSHIDS